MMEGMQHLSNADVHAIAGLHMNGSLSRATKKPAGRYHFYLDKVRLFLRFDPESILVKRNAQQVITGVLVYTRDEALFNRFAGPRCWPFYARALKALSGRYGFQPVKWMKALRASTGRGHGPPPPAQCNSNVPQKLAKIWVLLVAEEYRRRGIASGLLSTCESRVRAAGVKHLRVTVKMDNASAIAAYERHGFEKVGVCHESTGRSHVMQMAIQPISKKTLTR